MANDESNTNISILDYILIIVKWRKFILYNVAVITLFALVISLLLPKWFKASASILPPSKADMLGLIGGGSSLKNISSLGKLASIGQRSTAYNYLAILNSRSLQEAVIKKFDLIKVYETPNNSIEKTIGMLQDNFSVEEEKDDYISITVVDKDPVRAADMANYFIEMLNSISTKLAAQEGKDNRLFVEKRLYESQNDLHGSEELLKSYQEKNKMILSPDASASISQIASLYGLKTKKEIELAILRKATSNNNSEVQQIRLELSELEKKLSQFPEMGISSLRLYRDVAIQQRIVEYLIPIYEQTKIEEQKNIPIVLTLDKAVPAERKFRPKRLVIILVAFMASLLFYTSLVFVFERIKRTIEVDRIFAEKYERTRNELANIFKRRK
jgi:tyrosine-protein kinase Etk/Wzc